MNHATVVLGGHMTRDPEILFSKNGEPYCRFCVAFNDSKKVAIFFNCTAFGKTGDLIGQHFVKGQAILVSGELQANNWTTNDGVERKEIQVMVRSFSFCGKKDSAE